MTEVRTSSLCERPCAGIEDTLEASIGTGGPQSVFDAAMAPTQESGLRENRTSRLSERAEAGRTLHLSRLYRTSRYSAHAQGRAGTDPPHRRVGPPASTRPRAIDAPDNTSTAAPCRAASPA